MRDTLYLTRPTTDLPRLAPPAPRRFPAVPAAGVAGQLVLLGLLTATVGLGPVGWAAGVVYGLVLATTLTLALRRRRTSLGPADHVTLARATLAGCVTALVADTVFTPAPTALLVTVTTVALSLDAVDGRIARRTGTASPLGARFDMEVDAFLILVLSVFVAESLGAWVLVIGAMRYAFVVAGRALPWLNASLPHSMGRKTVAALQGIALTTACLLPFAAAAAVTGLALAALVWSFGRDVVWLHAAR